MFSRKLLSSEWQSSDRLLEVEDFDFGFSDGVFGGLHFQQVINPLAIRGYFSFLLVIFLVFSYHSVCQNCFVGYITNVCEQSHYNTFVDAATVTYGPEVDQK